MCINKSTTVSTAVPPDQGTAPPPTCQRSTAAAMLFHWEVIKKVCFTKPLETPCTLR
eukprot:TRINITY_DN5308_c0_g1_i1.p1 TRINITY_DN5308_c0_g1~~TRINITY_DN5308_c0_g1_i1.p1  ORF type:complete len:57 (-),score=10.33 TRINITY_DN5308_c0_g1_i1:5-175(-)